MQEPNAYIERGVSSTKQEIHAIVSEQKQGLFDGAFCRILPDHLTGDSDYCLLVHADGAGTKSSLAYIYWKETGDVSVFRDLAYDSLIMNLDDLAACGCVSNFMLSNTIGRNKHLIPEEVIREVIQGYDDCIDVLSRCGIDIYSCGGETADVGDLVRTLIIDSSLTTRMKRSDIINAAHIQEDSFIVGFASFGQALWETKYNSGISSNGLTAARHDGLQKIYANTYPESYAPQTNQKYVYSGKGLLSDPLEGTPLTLGQALLSPTRTYAPLIRKILKSYASQVQGLIHCTGGGQTKCLRFGSGIEYIKDNLFPIPPLFAYLQDSGNVPLREMMSIYNMGHRLEAFIKEESVANECIAMAQECGIEARIIGRTKAAKTKQNSLTIISQNEQLTYSL